RVAKAQTLTGEADDDALGALGTCQHCEASRKHPAINVTLELISHEPGQCSRETLLDGGVECAQVVAHDLVQRAPFRTPARVRWLLGHRRGLRNGRARSGSVSAARRLGLPGGGLAIRRRRAVPRWRYVYCIQRDVVQIARFVHLARYLPRWYPMTVETSPGSADSASSGVL